jgi:hypothetical protein
MLDEEVYPPEVVLHHRVRRRSRASALRRIPRTDPRLNAGLKLLDEPLHRIAAVANSLAVASEHPWQNKALGIRRSVDPGKGDRYHKSEVRDELA